MSGIVWTIFGCIGVAFVLSMVFLFALVVAISIARREL